MKKIPLLLAAIIFPLISTAQFCVTTYSGDDFDLYDVEMSVAVLEIDSLGNMWFGLSSTYNGVVGYFTGSQWHTIDPSFLPSPWPNAIAFDGDDSAWVATRNGLGIIDITTREGRQMTPDNSGLPEAKVTAIAIDKDNNKWMGFYSGRIARFNGSVWEEFTGISTSSVNAIEIDMDGSVWVGFNGIPGLVKDEGSGFSTIPGFSSVPAITADKWGRVIIASYDSVVIHTGLTITIVKAAAGNDIRDIAVGAGGGIWASSGQGLLYRRSDKFLRFNASNSSVPASLSSPIEFDQDNNLWFGYNYQGTQYSHSGTGFLYRTALLDDPIVTADDPSLKICYGDSLTLTADPDAVSYVWPDGSTAENTYVIYDSAEVPVAVEGDNRCYYYDTLQVIAQRVYEDEVICAASVDTLQKVIIIWERTPEVGTTSYNIYREVETDIYQQIGNVPVGLLSVFEDPDANPYTRAYRYKISSVDSCQNESGPSFYHQTLHLSINKGALAGDVNLHWTHYEGLSIGQYLIFKGPDPLNLVLYDSIVGNQQDYTDQNVFDTVYYKVGFRLPAICAPAISLKAGVGPYNHSLSNLDDSRKLFSDIPETRSPQILNAWPNPFTELTRIEFPNHRGTPFGLTLYEPGGRMVMNIDRITEGEVIIRREDLKPGVYFFKLSGEKLYQGKIMVQ